MNIKMIDAAATRLKGHARRTPMLSAPALDAMAGRRVLVKAECLQRTGSFKFRGAWSALSALPDATRQAGVVAFSSGNHAQGVALAAREHGVPAVIIMPKDAPATKIDGTRALGGEVVLYDRQTQDRNALGAEIAAARGLTLIKPFDAPQVIAGQGTCGLEIASQAAEHGLTKADVAVCCGGGGLASGIALALEARAPQLRVRPVEPEGFDDMTRSLAAGERLPNTGPEHGLCDAILTPMPGEITFPILSRLAGPGIAVTDDEALRAMALAFQHLKVVAEPGGAVALAACLFHPQAFEADAVICTISGGNVDRAVFERALRL